MKNWIIDIIIPLPAATPHVPILRWSGTNRQQEFRSLDRLRVPFDRWRGLVLFMINGDPTRKRVIVDAAPQVGGTELVVSAERARRRCLHDALPRTLEIGPIIEFAVVLPPDAVARVIA